MYGLVDSVCAGVLESCWAVGLNTTDGFRRPIPSLFVVITLAGSMLLLALAVRTLPISSAYAIWTGIGALGAVIGGIVIYHESVSLRALFIALLVLSMIGLPPRENEWRDFLPGPKKFHSG